MIVRIDSEKPDVRGIAKVVEVLKRGGIIIYPTDTVYTLGCDITQKKAYERICKLKKVKSNKANFSMVCYDLSHISDFTLNLPTPTYKLMKRVLPGPYTFILQANKLVQKIFGYKKKEIGIRVPDNNIAREIVKALGNPILSASIKHEDVILEYMTQPNELEEAYSVTVDLVVDGGIGSNIPSTVINCTVDPPEIVRSGLGETNSL